MLAFWRASELLISLEGSADSVCGWGFAVPVWLTRACPGTLGLSAPSPPALGCLPPAHPEENHRSSCAALIAQAHHVCPGLLFNCISLLMCFKNSQGLGNVRAPAWLYPVQIAEGCVSRALPRGKPQPLRVVTPAPAAPSAGKASTSLLLQPLCLKHSVPRRK